MWEHHHVNQLGESPRGLEGGGGPVLVLAAAGRAELDPPHRPGAVAPGRRGRGPRHVTAPSSEHWQRVNTIIIT